MEDPVRIGLVGLNFGAHLARRDIFSGPGSDHVRIAAVCDLNRAKAEQFGQAHQVSVCTDLDRLLDDPAVEAVGLFTPPAGRAELIRTCVSAGKHVMTTKPFELDPDAALTVLHEARGAGVVVHLNSPGPLPARDTAKITEWRETYALGEPIAARWETYGRYHETADGSWMDSPDKCPVAPVFRLGIYGINEVIGLLGTVESVHVTTSRMFTGRPTPDNAELTLQFANGAIGSVFASLCVGDGLPYPAGLVLHFENGTIVKRQVKDGSARRNADFRAVELKLECVHRDTFVEERYEFPAEYRSGAYQWANFHAAVRRGGPLADETAPETVAAGIAVIAAMARAEKTGARETVTACRRQG